MFQKCTKECNTLNADIISEVVRKLIGEIKPCGDSAIDIERRTNLNTLIHVMDILLDDVCEITTQRDRKEGSICQMVDMAEDAITDWHDLIEDYMGVNSAYTQPTVEPERKKSVWIKMSDRDGEYYCCNNCGEELPRYTKVNPSWDVPFPQKYSIDPTDFCPNCGSDNRGNKN